MATIRRKFDNKYASAAQLWLDQLTPEVLPVLDLALASENAQQNPALFRAKLSSAVLQMLLELVAADNKRGPGRPPSATKKPQTPAENGAVFGIDPETGEPMTGAEAQRRFLASLKT